MTPADVRSRLVQALRLDLIGPEPDEPQIGEILDRAPSRWYLTGFLAPFNAPLAQKTDDEAQDELDLAPEKSGDDEDDATETQAARRGMFPSSIGVSVLVPADLTEIRVGLRWGDYKALEKDGQLTGEWQRSEQVRNMTVTIRDGRPLAPLQDVPDSRGLQLMAICRGIRRPNELRGLAAGTRAVSVFLVNRRPPVQGNDPIKDEAFVFQASLTLEGNVPFVPRPNPRGGVSNDVDERIADLQYRDAMEFAVGHGTSTHATVVNGVCSKVETTWMPRAEVERVEAAAIQDVELRMEALASLDDATAARNALLPLVERYRVWIEGQREKAPKDGAQGEVAAELLQSARRAANRIEAGIESLEDTQSLEAFRIANRAMAMAARQRRAQERGVAPNTVEPPEWRPFQLAFLLMNLQAFADPSHPDRELVDLLFFPTGGGKTEAYLGLSAFAIVLRRLRNEGLTSAGVTVLMRYTLRLLTLDQLSRAATLICALEIIRREEGMARRLGTWPFEIGLWVGKAATPNRMGRLGDNDKTTARAKLIAFLGNSKNPSPIPLENCPWCGRKFSPQSFQPEGTLDAPTNLLVYCLGGGCPFKGKMPLPIVGVDEPIYRRLPCFVIATVDKFASLPWVGPSGGLLGGADRFDSAGFYGPWQPNTGQPLPRALAPPDLIIQDELHLISGPLGSMAGLYETAIDALCERNIAGHRVRPKIVASTATVRRASTQVRGLFARAGVEIFPPPGPDRRDSFFAKAIAVDESPGRLYVGLAAQGRALKVILLRTYLALLAAAEKAWREDGGTRNPDNAADPYMTLLGYFGSLRELGGSRRIVEDEVSSRVSAYSRQKRVNEVEGSFADRTIGREVAELTSRESTNRVADTKRRLALAVSDKEHVDVALATNMISVGLDITRLGLMVVLGQPKAAAEYIQATSRVGRDPKKPGLVVTLLNIHRPRDRSHYERFEAFHASFYRAVEATSVTPFAHRALDRALPALVVSLSRHTRSALTPSKGAVKMPAERAALEGVGDRLAARALAACEMEPAEAARLTGTLRGRAADLLDSWTKIARTQAQNASPLRYQKYEEGDGPVLLHTPLDPDLANLNADGRKFKAPRSLRDVEPSVNLWLKRLDNAEVEIEPDNEADN